MEVEISRLNSERNPFVSLSLSLWLYSTSKRFKMPPKPTSKHSQGKRKYNERRYPSTNEVSGPGIWVSCPRGKESATFHELVEVLGTVGGGWIVTMVCRSIDHREIC